jgi:hypothetical protein
MQFVPRTEHEATREATWLGHHIDDAALVDEFFYHVLVNIFIVKHQKPEKMLLEDNKEKLN